MSVAPASSPPKPQTKGPVELAVTLAFGTVFVAISAWLVGIAFEIVGSYTLWRDYGFADHAREMVDDDLRHIAAAPRSLLVDDTVAFSRLVVGWIALPYQKTGLLSWYARQMEQGDAPAPSERTSGPHKPAGALAKIKAASRDLGKTLGRWAVMSMYIAQDVVLRMSVAVFALPAFVLACIVGLIDGLVRRDLRRWGGGRETSFVYHHAKRYTAWALTGGFGLYLAWPFGGFNPAYMVLVFTLLVAAALSTTVATFKKYV